MSRSQKGILFLDILGAMPQDISKKAPCLIVEIVAGSERPVPFSRREPVEQLALYRAANRADAAPCPEAYFIDAPAKKLFQ